MRYHASEQSSGSDGTRKIVILQWLIEIMSASSIVGFPFEKPQEMPA
jgi:hypothetical protein